MSAHPELVKALEPILSRVRRDICWKKTEDGPRRIKEPLTDARMLQHVNGGPAYGAAPIHPGQSVTMAAVLDLDSHQGATSWPEMCEVAATIMAAGADMGLEMVPFRSSGGRGLHLYMLWDQPQDAYSVRMALSQLLAGVGFKNGAGGVSAGEIEVFPKQNSVALDKFGNMFILPLAGKSVPLCPLTLDDMPKDYAIGMDWPLSDDVPVLERETPVAPTVTDVSADAEAVRAALDAIPNSGADELNYDDWRNVVFALHNAFDGGPDGLALAHEFSARSSKYNAEFLDSRVWPYVKTDHDGERGGITVNTLFKIARDYGWVPEIPDDFEALPALVDEGGEAVQELPRFRRNDKGAIVACMENVVLAAGDGRTAGVLIRFDEFRAEVMLSPDGGANWRSFVDADYTRLQIHLERGGFEKLKKEMLRDAVWLVADNNRFDSAQEWAAGLRWDGRGRVESFLTAYMGVADTPYTRAVSRYLWTALAGRVLSPGCEAPMVPVFIGAQGAGKTRAVKALAPANDFYAELNLAERDAEASRRMRGRLVIELGELRGLHSRDAESIKAFISRTHEEWRVLYREFNTIFARRFLFVGTTNQEEFLADETGERRWLPVRVGACDVEAIQRDAGQLWAEGLALFTASGVDWSEAETLARGVHHEHKVGDPWAQEVADWLQTPDQFAEDGAKPCTREFLRIGDVLKEAIRLDMKQIGKREEMRMSKILQSLGYSRVAKWLGGKTVKVWVAET